MTIWLIAALAGLAFALLAYAARGVSLGRVLAPAVLRALAVTLVVALLLDAVAGRSRPLSALVALDVSASWRRGRDSTAFAEALRQARDATHDSVLTFGDSARWMGAVTAAEDRSSRARPIVERALAAGRPLTLFTDGEIDDPESLDGLPGGSRVIMPAATSRRDAALATLIVPRTAVAGDSLELRIGVVAGEGGAGRGTVRLELGGRAAGTLTLDSLAPFAERTLSLTTRAPAASGPALVWAVLSSEGDAEVHNDTLVVAMDVAPGAGAVLISSSPDYDSREMLALLRSTVALPTRGYYRVAAGNWRADGALGRVEEADVRRAMREAPLVIMHGDTGIFGAPRTLTRGSLALIAIPAQSQGDWYPTASMASPVASALTGIAWDSVPPLDVSPIAVQGDFEILETRRSRRLERRVAIAGWERPRRMVVSAASGFWRWRFRGGPSADAYSAVWGSIFDWLAGERSDARAAVTVAGSVRAGEAVVWRRGAGEDSVVQATLVRRGETKADTLNLRFASGVSLTETPALLPGIYDVRTRGGIALLAVNASREWLPRRRTVSEGGVGKGPALSDAPRLRGFGWIFGIAIVALCGEWGLRRRAGLR